MAENDVKNNQGYFSYTKKNNTFEKCLYLSKSTLKYADYFLDIVLVDSTCHRNRFNLALANVFGVNNYGNDDDSLHHQTNRIYTENGIQVNLVRAMQRIIFRTKQKKCVYGLFICFSNAYNSIPHYPLFKKLRAKKILEENEIEFWNNYMLERD